MKLAKITKPSKAILNKINLKGKKGMLAMIEPETGDAFTGKNVMEALKKARKKYPHKIFYCIRIGFPYAHEHKGGIQKV